MKTTQCKFTFLNPKFVEEFIDKDIYNLTCTNHLDEPFMVEFMRKPLSELGIDIELKSFEEIDKSKSWFIDLPMLFYKWDEIIKQQNKGLFDCFPRSIIDEVNNGNGYLIFNQQNETDTILTYQKFYELYNKNPEVKLNKIIIMSPSRLAEECYYNWCEEKNIPKENRVKIIYASHIDLRFNDYDINYWSNINYSAKDKLFLNLNRNPRIQRVLMVSALHELGLAEQGLISLWYDFNKDDLVNQVLGMSHMFSNSSTGKKLFELIFSGLLKIKNKLPIYLDVTDMSKNPAGFSATDRSLYERSYINLTSTTFFFNWQEPSPGWNEKEWKPVLAKQPFILFSRPGALQSMKNFGILTFDKFIDESYDYIKDDIERFWFILQELTRLSKLSKDDLDKMLKELDFVLNYNLEYTNSKRWEQVFYTSGLKDLLKFL